MSLTRAVTFVLKFLWLSLVVIAVGSLPGARWVAPTVKTQAPVLAAIRGALNLKVTQTTGAAVVARVRIFYRKDDSFLLFSDLETNATGETTASAPPGDLLVLAEAPGLARQSKRLILLAEPRDLSFVLPASRAVEVSVVTDDGTPIAQAEVELRGGDPSAIGKRTDAKGLATLSGASGESFALLARAPGFEPRTLRSTTANANANAKDKDAGSEGPIRMQVTLHPLSALLVSVLDVDGKPAKHARVRIASSELWPPQESETEDDGSLRISGLKPGAYALRADKGQTVSSTEVTFLAHRSIEEPVVLKLAAGFSLRATVRDEDSDTLGNVQLSVLESGISAFPIEALTDKSGTQTIGPIFPGLVWLKANKSGYVPKHESFTELGPSAAGAVVRELVLLRGGTLEGRVVDGRGFPITSATLRIAGNDPEGQPIDEAAGERTFSADLFTGLARSRSLGGAGALGVVPLPQSLFGGGGSLAPQVRFDAPGVPAAAEPTPVPKSMQSTPDEPWISGRSGEFRIFPAPPGRVRVIAKHPEFTEGASEWVSLSAGNTGRVTIVLSRGGGIEGKVPTHEGRPAAGLLVRAEGADGNTRNDTTASDGSFAFASLTKLVSLSVLSDARDGRVLVHEEVSVPEAGLAKVVLTLPAGRETLEVQVVDGRGDPVANAQVTCESLSAAEPTRSTEFTDARGKASVRGVRGLPTRLVIVAPGFADKSVDIAAEAQGTRVTLTRGERLFGILRTRHGDPAAFARIEVIGAKRTFLSSKDGAFDLPDLPPGPAHIRVRATGMAPFEKTFTVREDPLHRGTDARTLELTEEATLEGTVMSARGEPVAGARVALDHVPTFITAGQVPDGVALTNRKGVFTLRGLAAGTHTVEVYAPDHGRVSEEVHLDAGRTTKGARFTLKAPADVANSQAAQTMQSGASLAVTLGESRGRVVLASVTPESGAERAGLQAGDEILRVNGTAVANMEAARAKMTGPQGDDVWLELRRAGAESTTTVRVPRDQVRK
jgi:Carboxypeptidase regulatory-like domain/PDZ domain